MCVCGLFQFVSCVCARKCARVALEDACGWIVCPDITPGPSYTANARRKHFIFVVKSPEIDGSLEKEQENKNRLVNRELNTSCAEIPFGTGACESCSCIGTVSLWSPLSLVDLRILDSHSMDKSAC